MIIPVPNTPKHVCTLPVSKKKVTFRGFLVKEEKILLLAAEDTDFKSADIQNAIKQTLKNCTFDAVDINKLPTADVEYLFVQIRINSVGEEVDGTIKCAHCDAKNNYVIDLRKVEVVNEVTDLNIRLDDEIIVTMSYPTLGSITSPELNYKGPDKDLAIIASMIEMITINDKVLHKVDLTIKDIMVWLEYLDGKQIAKLNKFLEQLPKIVYADKVKCNACGNDITVYMSGLEDFFI